MTDPFTPIETPLAPPAGDLDVVRAILDGVAAVPRNALSIVVGAVAMVVVLGVSVASLVGWIVSVPLVVWGLYRFLVAAVDGRVKDTLLWDEGYLRMTLRGWGIVLGLVLAKLPASVAVQLLLPAVAPTEVWTALLVSLGPGIVWGLVLVRLAFAPWLVVDRGFGTVQAFVGSWHRTAGIWPQLAAIYVIELLLLAPALLVLLAGGRVPFGLVSFQLLLTVNWVGAGFLGLLFQAAAYRQRFPRP